MRLRAKKRKITVRMVLFYLTVFLIGFYVIFEKMSISVPQYPSVKRYILVAIFFLLVTKANVLPVYMNKKRYFRMILALIIFTGYLFSSAYMNKHRVYDTNPMSHALSAALIIWEIYFMIIYAVERDLLSGVIRLLCVMFVVSCAVVDVVFVYIKLRYGLPFFLIGTKFELCYVHVYSMAFFLMDRYLHVEKPKGYVLLIGLFGAYSVAIAILADCMTGAIGILLFVAAWILFCKDKLNLMKLISSPAVVVLLLVVNLLITFAFEALIQFPSVYTFITNVLGRSATMTGRLNIYKDYLAKTAGHMFFGYGMGNANQICKTYFGYADTQNAILEWVIQIGVLGTVALLCTIVEAFRRVSQCKNKKRMLPFALLIYIITVLGTVEITFTYNFFLCVAILFGCCLKNGKKGSNHIMNSYVTENMMFDWNMNQTYQM